jgi:hypothetical protein
MLEKSLRRKVNGMSKNVTHYDNAIYSINLVITRQNDWVN